MPKEVVNMEEKKESIYREIRHRGMRLTKQRRLLVDIILKMNVIAVRRFTTKLQRRITPLDWRPFTGWSSCLRKWV